MNAFTLFIALAVGLSPYLYLVLWPEIRKMCRKKGNGIAADLGKNWKPVFKHSNLFREMI